MFLCLLCIFENKKQTMKKLIVLTLFASLLFNKAYPQEKLKNTIDSLASVYLQNKPGALVIGIIDNGKESVYYYGETEKGNGKLPDENNIFELGELSETFSCILYADMTLKGLINADDKLKDFLPVDVPAPVYQEVVCKPVTENPNNIFYNPDNSSTRFTPYVCFPDPSSKPQEIILCDLATHTTGLPKYPYNIKLRNKETRLSEYTQESLYSFLKTFHFEKPIGYDYKHSSLGIALLGHALSLKAKTEFDTLMTERLFAPLKMNDTRVTLSPEQQQKLLKGYDENGNVMAHRIYNVLAPALGLNSNITDLMKFLALNISMQKDYYVDLLNYTHNARIKITGKKNKDREIALGWKINPIANEKRVVWQSGMSGGFASYIGFVETNHTGVVILSSVAKDVQQTGEQIVNAIRAY